MRRDCNNLGDLPGEAREERQHLVVLVSDSIEVRGHWTCRHDATLSCVLLAGQPGYAVMAETTASDHAACPPPHGGQTPGRTPGARVRRGSELSCWDHPL